MDRRDTRFALESTIGNVSGLEFSLDVSSESASSTQSSSSSIALSEISSSESYSSSESLSIALPSSALMDSMNFFLGISVIFSMNAVCFLSCLGL